MDISHNKEKELVWVQILYLYVAPTILLYFGVIPPQFRVVMLLGVSLIMLGIIRHAHWTHEDIGISRPYLKGLLPYAIFTAVGVLITFSLTKVAPHIPLVEWWEDVKFLLLFIPISVLQEVVFRGVLMNMLRRAFKSPVFIILLNSVVFALMHVIYIHSAFVLPFTFIAGIGFATMYYFYPNLVLISASHTILNFTAMILGFFIAR